MYQPTPGLLRRLQYHPHGSGPSAQRRCVTLSSSQRRPPPRAALHPCPCTRHHSWDERASVSLVPLSKQLQKGKKMFFIQNVPLTVFVDKYCLTLKGMIQNIWFQKMSCCECVDFVSPSANVHVRKEAVAERELFFIFSYYFVIHTFNRTFSLTVTQDDFDETLDIFDFMDFTYIVSKSRIWNHCAL